MTGKDWNHGRQAGLVSVGTHEMYLTAAGPDRGPESRTPAIIFESGFSDSHVSLIAIPRFLGPKARVFMYDRSGFGKSQPSPYPRTAVNMAKELASLLAAANIHPPFIHVAHSFGAVVAREFLELVGTGENGIVGMVLIDGNHEDTRRDKNLLGIPGYAYKAVMDNTDYLAITGVDTNNKLTPEEWLGILNYPEGDQTTFQEAQANSELMHKVLGQKKQLDRHILGKYPLSIIKGYKYRDFKMILEWVKDHGNGSTREEQEAFEKGLSCFAEIDESLARDQLSLNSEVGEKRYVYAEKSGHLVPFEEPELIAKEISWVLSLARGRVEAGCS